MSTNPSDFIERLRSAAAIGRGDILAAEEIVAVLAILDHQDEQLKALRAEPAATPPPPVAPIEETVCQEADRITSSSRQADYGHPIYNLTRTARMWEVILDVPAGSISPEAVGLCMIGTKLARECYKPKRDNLTDICGYAKVVDMIRNTDLSNLP